MKSESVIPANFKSLIHKEKYDLSVLETTFFCNEISEALTHVTNLAEIVTYQSS